MRVTLLGWCVVCLLLPVLSSTALATESEWNVSSAAYGRGVHAYFAGRYSVAEAWLDRALAYNPDDPRAFYFRALTLKRLGRGDEACSDLEIGAALEAEAVNRYSVGAALQRVQGADRLVLERYRQQARLANQLQREADLAGRSSVRTDEQEVLYQPVVVPLDEFLSPQAPRSLTREELERRAAAAAARANAAAAVQSGVAPPDPFQDDAAEGSAPAPPVRETPPPTAVEPQRPVETEAAPPPPADAEDDPFLDL